MKPFLAATLLACFLNVVSFTAEARNSDILHACKLLLTKKWPQWDFAPVSAEVAESAKERKESATITYGDFNGDSRKDVAMLIHTNAQPNRRLIAICLTNPKKPRLAIINKPYCSDGIELSHKGRQYYNFETEAEGTYQYDGVACCWR